MKRKAIKNYLTLLMFFPFCSFSQINQNDLCSLCEVNNVSEVKFDVLEKKILPSVKDLAKRLNDSTLILKIGLNEHMTFLDTNDEENVERLRKYYLIEYDKKNEIYVIGKGYWEGERSYILMKKNGIMYELLDRPVFNKKHSMLLCCASDDMNAEYGIAIWKINNCKADKTWDTTLSTSAVPVETKWSNDSLIVGCLTSYDTKKNWTFNIKLKGEQWKFIEVTECKKIKE